MKRDKLLNEIKTRIKQVKPFTEIWLYGSRADGTANIGSD